MKIVRNVALLALLAGPVAAEPAGCDRLAAVLEALTGYRVTAPAAAPEGGWCVLDRAGLEAGSAPELAADRLRLRGEMAEGVLVELAVVARGLRLAPGLGQRDIDPVLRETLRLQAADLSGVFWTGPEGLSLREGRLALSGGTEVSVEAEMAGAGLTSAALVRGRLTWARVAWRNDGKFLRPVMLRWGESLVDGALGPVAVDAARLTLQHVVHNLPGEMFRDEGQERLEGMLDHVPQGRGRLVLDFRSVRGIGATDLALAALSGDPLGPEALARLFAGAVVDVDWVPGIGP